MIARGVSDLGKRLAHLPGRVWCVCWHRGMWKPWRTHERWVSYRCRICWREHVYQRS
jgi:hypothetical protein